MSVMKPGRGVFRWVAPLAALVGSLAGMAGNSAAQSSVTRETFVIGEWVLGPHGSAFYNSVIPRPAGLVGITAANFDVVDMGVTSTTTTTINRLQSYVWSSRNSSYEASWSSYSANPSFSSIQSSMYSSFESSRSSFLSSSASNNPNYPSESLSFSGVLSSMQSYSTSVSISSANHPMSSSASSEQSSQMSSFDSRISNSSWWVTTVSMPSSMPTSMDDSMSHDPTMMDHTVHLHHVVVVQTGADPLCPSRTQSGFKINPILGAGMERTPIEFPDPYVLRVPAAGIWGANIEVNNMTDQVRRVQVTMTLDYVTDLTGKRFLSPYFMSAAGDCWDVYLWNPGDGGAGSTYTTSNTFTIPRAGQLIGTGAHLHEGGIATELRRESNNELLCRSAATHVDEWMIDTIDYCDLSAGEVRIAKDERVRLDAIYDNKRSWSGGMGINIAYMWHGEAGPAISTSSASTTATASARTPSSTTLLTSSPVLAATTTSVSVIPTSAATAFDPDGPPARADTRLAPPPLAESQPAPLPPRPPAAAPAAAIGLRLDPVFTG